jgi:deoxyribodipyrimidine photo-lyase
MNSQRIQNLVEAPYTNGPVVYWMSRDQRVRDNWALLYAQELARKQRAPLGVVFVLSPRFLDATLRQYEFMLQGLEEVERSLSRLDIPFFLLAGSPVDVMLSFVKRHRVGSIVTDFSPLRIHRSWKKQAAKAVSVPFQEVDAHNIVPCWIASDKREYAAATFRPKINRMLPMFLEEFPRMTRPHHTWNGEVKRTDWQRVRKRLEVDTTVRPVAWLKPGEEAATGALEKFIEQRLRRYGTSRNDPTANAQSNLSPYLHFGQLSP